MKGISEIRRQWVTFVIVAAIILVMIGSGSAQSASMGECETEDCEQHPIDESLTRMLDQFNWGTESEDDRVMSADKMILTTETENGKIHVIGDVSPDETVTIILTDGLANADVRVNGEPVAPTDAGGDIEVIVPEDGEVTIVIESKQADHEIYLDGSETGTDVSTSTSSKSSSASSESSLISTESSTTVSTSASNSVSSDSG